MRHILKASPVRVTMQGRAKAVAIGFAALESARTGEAVTK